MIPPLPPVPLRMKQLKKFHHPRVPPREWVMSGRLARAPPLQWFQDCKTGLDGGDALREKTNMVISKVKDKEILAAVAVNS